MKYIPKGPIDNIPALVQIVAWRQLDEPTGFSGGLEHWNIVIWLVKLLWLYMTVRNKVYYYMMVWFTDAYTRHSAAWV